MQTDADLMRLIKDQGLAGAFDADASYLHLEATLRRRPEEPPLALAVDTLAGGGPDYRVELDHATGTGQVYVRQELDPTRLDVPVKDYRMPAEEWIPYRLITNRSRWWPGRHCRRSTRTSARSSRAAGTQPVLTTTAWRPGRPLTTTVTGRSGHGCHGRCWDWRTLQPDSTRRRRAGDAGSDRAGRVAVLFRRPGVAHLLPFADLGQHRVHRTAKAGPGPAARRIPRPRSLSRSVRQRTSPRELIVAAAPEGGHGPSEATIGVGCVRWLQQMVSKELQQSGDQRDS